MFTFTEDELRDERVSHARFTQLLNDQATKIHVVKLSENNYGEWLFATLSARVPPLYAFAPKPAKAQSRCITFWGMGFHDAREEWTCESWRMFEAGLLTPGSNTPTIPKTQAWSTINERRAFCLAQAPSAAKPSAEAQAFSFFAELGDEDGAASMLEDMEALGVNFEGLFDE